MRFREPSDSRAAASTKPWAAASIPISCLLNVLITGKVFSTGQLTGISIVILGLAVKAKALLDSNDDDDAAGFPAVAVAPSSSPASDTPSAASRWSTSATTASTGGR